MDDYERREREAQRRAVEAVLTGTDEGSVLRTTSGEVLVYDEGYDKRRPVKLRAVVMPDGETQEFETTRFKRR